MSISVPCMNYQSLYCFFFFFISRCSWESWLCYSCDLIIIFFLSQHGDSGLFIHLKVQSSCLKFSTYSFIYRDCGLLQNEKVRDVHSAVTQFRLNIPYSKSNMWTMTKTSTLHSVLMDMDMWLTEFSFFVVVLFCFFLHFSRMACHAIQYSWT